MPRGWFAGVVHNIVRKALESVWMILEGNQRIELEFLLSCYFLSLFDPPIGLPSARTMRFLDFADTLAISVATTWTGVVLVESCSDDEAGDCMVTTNSSRSCFVNVNLWEVV